MRSRPLLGASRASHVWATSLQFKLLLLSLLFTLLIHCISGNQVQCSVLLKAICSLLRTPIASIDNLSVKLPDPDASKVQWALECYSGAI
nr:hypothetical protein CFP56_06411 [Quercus suber]